MKVMEAEYILELASTRDPQLHRIVEFSLMIGIMPSDIPPITEEVLTTGRLTLPGGREIVLGVTAFAMATRLDLPNGSPGGAFLDARWRRLARSLDYESDTINDVLILASEREIDFPIRLTSPKNEWDGEVPF